MSTDLHERTLSIETQPLDGDRLAVHAELRDVRHVDMPAHLGVSHPAGVVHHMVLDVELDRALTIVGVDAAMHAIPFEPSEKTRGEGCRNVLPNYQRLIGIPVDAGYALRVMETVGGRRGCFHILSLAQCLPLAVRAASGRLCGAALRMPEASGLRSAARGRSAAPGPVGDLTSLRSARRPAEPSARPEASQPREQPLGGELSDVASRWPVGELGKLA